MKNLIYYLSNQGVSWSLIWDDCSIFLIIFMWVYMIVVIWAAKNYYNSIRKEIQEEYLVKTTAKLCAYERHVFDLNVKNNELSAKNEILSQSVRKRDEKGHFLPVSGKGHGKKKVLIL